MSKENINNLLNFLKGIDKKIFNDVKDLSSIDQNILNKFISLKENLENLENLENFKTIIKRIANETDQTSEIILNRLKKFRSLKLI